MLARTEGNCVSAFTLGSQGILSTAWASASPFRFVFCCIQRSASTISVGYVDAARTCATKASGYRAIGATSCSSCWGGLLHHRLSSHRGRLGSWRVMGASEEGRDG